MKNDKKPRDPSPFEMPPPSAEVAPEPDPEPQTIAEEPPFLPPAPCPSCHETDGSHTPYCDA